jgi:hypothetical protein
MSSSNKFYTKSVPLNNKLKMHTATTDSNITKFSFRLFVLILINTFNVVNAQDITQLDTTASKIDTFKLEYRFKQGDTLIYSRRTEDSSAFNFATPFIRNREERILIICDSVVAGVAFLNQTLIAYLEDGFKGKDTVRMAKDHPWIGRTIYFALDTLGKRYTTWYADSSTDATAPGGAFMPALLPPIVETYKSENEDWYAKISYDLLENGSPKPIADISNIFRFIGLIDTTINKNGCGKAYNLGITYTGQGLTEFKKDTTMHKMNSTINGFTKCYIDTLLKLPVYIFSTQEQKLKYTKSGKISNGYQYSTSHSNLIAYLPAIIKPQEKKPKPKKKK